VTKALLLYVHKVPVLLVEQGSLEGVKMMVALVTVRLGEVVLVAVLFK